MTEVIRPQRKQVLSVISLGEDVWGEDKSSVKKILECSHSR